MSKLRQTCSMSQQWKLGAKRCKESQCFHDKFLEDHVAHTVAMYDNLETSKRL